LVHNKKRFGKFYKKAEICNPKPKSMKPEKLKKEEKVIFESYMNYFISYSSRNWESMLETFHPDISVIGTGLDEIKLTARETIEFFRREFEQAPEMLRYQISDVHVQIITDETALVLLACDMEFKTSTQTFFVPDNRTTAVMKKTVDGWKLFHGHWSQPAIGQDVGESIPYKKLQEENKHLEQLVKARTRQIEKQNEKLEKLNKTKNHLFSIIAHDLRSPFNSFLGLSEVMMLNFEKNYPKKEYFHTRLGIINQQARYLFSIADNLLNWARTQIDEVNVELKNCTINTIIEEQLAGLKELYYSKKIDIQKVTTDEIVFLTDPEIVSIVTRNVLTNAIKYSFEGGIINIETQLVNSHLVIAINDFGAGISKKQIAKIMQSDSFVVSSRGTNNEKGTGIGLRLCIELLKNVNGELSIQSKLGKGTTVVVKIPEYLSA
jgi:signal transduction histidine kinase